MKPLTDPKVRPDLWGEADRLVETSWTTGLSAGREELWPLLADTSDLNERLGLPEMRFEERDGQLYGSSGRGLLRQEWVEVPWEWETARWLTAERHYSKGPATAVRVRFLLEEGEPGTRLAVHISWVPRSWWSSPILRSINCWLRRRYELVLQELDELAGQQVSRPTPTTPDSHAKVDEIRLRRAADELSEGKLSRTDVDRLANFIRSGSDQQLFRIRPKRLAFEWGVELEELLSLLLRATRAGLLRLSWDVMCPHCQGVRKESRSLGDLREFGRCDVCDIDFDATGLESIEVTFRVLEEVRAVREVFYCSAEPAKKPHILLQHQLGPGETYATELSFTPGRYRLRQASGDAGKVSFEAGKDEGGDGSLRWDAGGPGGNPPGALARRARLELVNPDQAGSVLVVLEKLAEDATALRPSELFNFQQFRDLFSEESIASGLKLEVGYQTLLFTDIVGSSQLYRELGDTRAFNTVHAHFVALQEIVGSRGGAVVKTIGDALMAAFQRPEDALAAAVEIQRRFRGDEVEPLTLRASLHRGVCLAVRLEANIDYFGRAVNEAAKMEAMAGAREIVMSGEFFKQPGIADQVGELGLELEELSFSPPASAEGEINLVMLASVKP